MSKHIALPRLNQLAASIAVVVGGLALVPAAHAAAPKAGATFSNIATATYVDNTGTSRNTTSNEVTTTVLQVASFTLTANNDTTANPNAQVSLPHTLTNTGNGNDTFKIDLINLGGDDYDFSGIAVYLDANKDGVPDNTTNLNGTTISVNAGQSVGLLVVGTTLNTATNNQLGKLQVSATNVFSTTATGGSNAATTANNTDTVKIVAGAVIEVTKAASVGNVNPNGTVAQRTVEYTLTYKNKGNDVATNVTLKDILPANVTYVPGSGVWSGSATARTDASGDEVGAAYDFTTNTVNFVVGSVAPNTTGTLKFKVTVNAGAPSGDINNYATFDPDGNGPQAAQPTNTVPVTVDKIYAGTINDSQTDVYSDAQKDTANTAKDDVITATTQQGVAVNFGNVAGGEKIWIHNTGNVADSFNVTVDKTNLPSGSTVELLQADGITPFTSTGSIPVNGALQIVARVTLPATYTGPVPVSAVLSIKPASDNTALADTITLRITSITASKVDLSNGKGDKDGVKNDTPNAGEGAYIAADIINTIAANPGATVTFPLAVTNFGSTPDNFNISSDLPAGWTVKYFTADAAGTCSANQVVNTGSIAVNGTAYLCAQVTSPANATPADSREIVFTVTSGGTGLTDSIKDKLNINEVRSLAFTPDRIGQVTPGGTVIYTHTLTNNGNVTEGAGANTLQLAISHAGSFSATTSVYVDLNNNNVADATELVTGNNLDALLAGAATPGGAGLQPGEVVKILVKVEAPANATAGQTDNSTITVTPTAGSAVKVDDKTTVNLGQVRLLKEQSLDANCDGTEDGGVASYTQNSISAKPGQCVIYRITATNDGNVPVTNVVINDASPQYTKISLPAASNDGTTGTVTTPAANATGTVTNTVGSLAPAASAKLKFGVKVDN